MGKVLKGLELERCARCLRPGCMSILENGQAICASCYKGHQIETDDNFCRTCGSKLMAVMARGKPNGKKICLNIHNKSRGRLPKLENGKCPIHPNAAIKTMPGVGEKKYCPECRKT